MSQLSRRKCLSMRCRAGLRTRSSLRRSPRRTQGRLHATTYVNRFPLQDDEASPVPFAEKVRAVNEMRRGFGSFRTSPARGSHPIRRLILSIGHAPGADGALRDVIEPERNGALIWKLAGQRSRLWPGNSRRR